MVPDILPERVALPQKNPVTVAKAAIGQRNRSELPFRRTRVLSKEEMQTVKAWCMEKVPSFWDDIKMAMLTSLRKADLLALKGGDKVSGIQGKTQQPFDLPITLERSVNPRGLRTRWDALRADLGWDKRGTPQHTTWHDLRHCGPTLMAEMDISSRIIQSVLGHSRPEMSERYTNVRQKAMQPAIDALRQELDSL